MVNGEMGNVQWSDNASIQIANRCICFIHQVVKVWVENKTHERRETNHHEADTHDPHGKPGRGRSDEVGEIVWFGNYSITFLKLIASGYMK